MLTIARLKRRSIAYYTATANEAKQAALDRQTANGGLGEYYTEGDTRIPTWLVTGDSAAVSEATGLVDAALHGGEADSEVVTTWLDHGRAPNGTQGRAYTDTSVHGFDLTFAAPKSVSLIRALTDDVAEKIVAAAHAKAVQAAMEYLHQHAGYTRVHNTLTGAKDLQRLPGLVAVAYQHETSRCGDPHLHTHVIVPNRQPRRDGQLVSLDSKSLHHEAKAAGIVYQATLRRELYAERGFEWNPVDAHTGMAEIAGVDTACIKAWSQRSTRLREWARDNLVVVEGEPTAAQLAAAQKATRPEKPEGLAWADLKAQWRTDVRGLVLDRAAHFAARTARRADVRSLDAAHIAHMTAHIDKAAFTRADLVEVVGAQLPVDAVGEPRALIEDIVDAAGVRVSAARAPHEREGSERFTVAPVIAEEERILDLVDRQESTARLDVRAEDVGDLSVNQQRVIRSIALSPFLVQPLQAPAGAGKTHSLKALRAAAHRARKEVLVLAPTGKAVDEAMSEGAGDRGLTVAKALHLIADQRLQVTPSTVVIIDEASMLGTPELQKLMSCAAAGRSKMVLVGDPYQLAPVKARGGMFEQLCAELPWSQRLGEVWRMRSVEERDASLALRSAQGRRLRTTVKWYREQGRLHTGDPIAMAADALAAYTDDHSRGRDALIICDTWEMADALNRRLHDTFKCDGPMARCGRDQDIGVGDLIMSRTNDATLPLTPADGGKRGPVDQVRNGNRWRVKAIDPRGNWVAAERLADGARVVFEGEYLRGSVTLGYAATVHSAQGVTADRSYAILSERASRAMLYVAMTRGRDNNQAFIYKRFDGEADHEHSKPLLGDAIHVSERGSKYAAAHRFRSILANDDRPRSMHTEADRAERALLPRPVIDALQRNEFRRYQRDATWRDYVVTERTWSGSAMGSSKPAHRHSLGRDGAGMEL
ncbi:relaxase domain-containing protein [Mycolicibacterium sp. BiH015]|uniref:MobF family relaxase n=1 Tax=Mycolicibacterium sp. BiH015 TaxID=3018808 RepID=UPI0022E58DE3|nr:MobF family relaxase [Mycolicibacterium sp. BiH015]MDA2893380.1 relaxase domain-containing protein [Mycolicibacterium sp. BiH015]